LQQSIALLQQALELEPNYAAAWDQLAAIYVTQVGLGSRPRDDGVRLARVAAANALANDRDYAPALDRLGWIAMIFDGDLAAAARHYERALTLEPSNTDIIGNAATLASNLGRLGTTIALNEYANARDPVEPIGFSNLGLTYLDAGRLDDAITAFRTALRLAPTYSGAYYGVGVALLRKGDAEAALVEMQKEPEEVWRLLGLAMIHHTLGSKAESDAALRKLTNEYADAAAYNIAYVLAWRGERDHAFEWLDRAVTNQDPGLSEIACQPLFANLHEDSRWLPFLKRIGKAPEQLAAVRFEVTTPAEPTG
jgi:tetratricopeptide (TPR) repeat protein